MNRNSLGVEMCSDIVGGKYTITPQTVDRAVELVKYLMAKYGIDVDHVVRHYDVTGKLCPEPWVRDESLWRKFKARLTAPVEPEPKKEDDEVVEKKNVMLNGKTYDLRVHHQGRGKLHQDALSGAGRLYGQLRCGPQAAEHYRAAVPHVRAGRRRRTCRPPVDTAAGESPVWRSRPSSICCGTSTASS